MRLILTKGVSNPIVQLMASIGLAIVLWIAIADAIHGRMSMGDLLGFIIALVSIAQPLREVVGVAGPLQQGIAAAQSLFELLDEPEEPQGGTLTTLRVRGEVEFDRVSFAYDGGNAAGADAAGHRWRQRRGAVEHLPQGRRRRKPCHRRPLRQRQVDPGQPAAALLRRGRRQRAHRRRRRARVRPASACASRSPW